MKKYLLTLLAVLLCAAMLCACGEAAEDPKPTAEPTKAPETTPAPAPTDPPVDPQPTDPVVTDEMQDVKLSDLFAQEVWEDDGGDVSVEADKIVFDNGYMGDFAALRMTQDYKNVNYKFTLQLEEIPEGLSEAEGTWWDAEFMILLRSALAAPGWEDGQTGYSLTAWGDMKQLYIGRSGHDDAFGSVEWGCADGQPHEIEFSAQNNEDNTTVALKLIIDGEVVFEQVDDGSITKEDRTPLFPDAGGLTIRCKYVKATIS